MKTMKTHPKDGPELCYDLFATARTGMLALLLSGAAAGFDVKAAGRSALEITKFTLEAGGVISLEWSGVSKNIVVQLTPTLTSPDWQPFPGQDWPIDGTSWTGVVPEGQKDGFIRLLTLAENGPPLPSKTISLALIGIHDPDSTAHNGDCISCHGDRTDEKAVDGITVAAHGAMLPFFGTGNDRCLHCHETGPNFLTGSAGGLRKQTSMVNISCVTCHGKGSTLEFYDTTP